MNWDEGTSGDVPLQRQVTAEVPLEYGSVVSVHGPWGNKEGNDWWVKCATIDR